MNYQHRGGCVVLRIEEGRIIFIERCRGWSFINLVAIWFS